MADYLRLEGIRKSFGAFQALKEIDLTIAEGEFVCFLGPSGCGKTTLLRIIAGLETQTAGRIVQGVRDISLLPPAERDYGIVFQSYALFPNLSIADNVAYGLVNRKVAKTTASARVDELLKLVGLPGSGAKFPAQLSGGQQQRIALALQDLARGLRLEAGDDAQQRRLAAARRTEEADELALRDRQVDVLERLEASERFPDSFEAEVIRHRDRPISWAPTCCRSACSIRRGFARGCRRRS